MLIPESKQITVNQTPQLPTITLQQINAELDRLNKADGSIKNIKSALNKMIILGFIDVHNIEHQFRDDFINLKNEVRAHINVNGSNRSWPSFLNDIRHAIDAIATFDVSGLSLADALYVLGKRKYGQSLSRYRVCVLLGAEPAIDAPKMTLEKWIYARALPRYRDQLEMLAKVDKVLGAKNVLRDKALPLEALQTNPPAAVSPSTDTRLAYPFTKEFLADFDRIRSWKIYGISALHGLEQPYLSGITNKEERRIYERPAHSTRWAVHEDGACPTGDSVLKAFSSMASKLDPTGVANLQILDFFDFNTLSAMASEAKNSSSEIAASHILRFISSECDRRSFVSKYCSSEKHPTREDWWDHLDHLREDCVELNADLKVVINSKNKGGFGRCITPIIESGRAAEIVKEISGQLWRQRGFYMHLTPSYMAAATTSILFDLLFVRPLRIRNMNEMKWLGTLSEKQIYDLKNDPKPMSVLYKNENKGVYTLLVKKACLKNRTSQRIGDIMQSFPYLTKRIDQYIDDRQAFLDKHAATSEYLFFLLQDVNLGCPREPNVLSQIFKRWTLRATTTLYGKDSALAVGINPHGMRHLVATMFLDENPENYTVVATLLMDSLEMVLSTYARVNHVGNEEKITNWAAGVMA